MYSQREESATPSAEVSGSPRGRDTRRFALRQFVVKVHSRCNLACDYCYVYTKTDQRWRTRPAVMSPEIMTRTAERVAEHVRERGVSQISVVLHGGEPLLAGPARLAYCVEQFRDRLDGAAEVNFSVQTNAVRLDHRFLELFRALHVRVGVSLDGGAQANDQHRRFRGGAGSYPRVRAGLERLREPRYRHLFAGLIATIDPDNPPEQTYQELCEFAPPMIDFLLPHGNWTDPPAGHGERSDTRYGDWLVAVFDRWYDTPRPSTRIRFFEEIMNLLLGGASRVETVGLSPPAMVVIETDGSVEDSGALNATYQGAAATGLHIARDPLTRVLPAVPTRARGLTELPPLCRSCHLRRVCGGGMVAHRYRHDTGFANPSVYCRDLERLITHIHARMRADLPALRASVQF